MRTFNEITNDLSERRTKAQGLYAELREVESKLKENPSDPGLEERARRLQAGAKRVADEVEELQREGRQAYENLDPRSLEAGDGNDARLRPSENLGKQERLGASESVTAWAKANRLDADAELESGVTPDEAWGAWFKGFMSGDWSGFRGMVKNQLSTSPDADGGFLVPTVLSTRVIDLLRSRAPIFDAGAQTVPMTSKTHDIARIGADVDATEWHAENASITASKPTLERVRFTAKTLPVLVKASRELAEDAPNVGAVVAQSIAGASAVELTRAALRGDGSSNSPTGIANQSGIGTTAGVGEATWDDLANAVRDIAQDDAMPNAYIAAPRTATALELTKTSDGQYVAPPPSVEDLGRFTTTVIPTDLGAGNDETELYVGDFTKLLIGVRTGLRIEPLRERFADNGQVAWLSWLRLDVQLEHPEAFNLLSGIAN